MAVLVDKRGAIEMEATKVDHFNLVRNEYFF